MVEMAQRFHVWQKYEDYQAFESAIECYQSAEIVQFYIRDSRKVLKANPCIQIKWPSRGSNQQPPLLKSSTLPTDLLD